MKVISFPAFGESDFSYNLAGRARVFVIRGADEECFSRYEEYLGGYGFVKREERDIPAEITQLNLEDFGMCYVVRLPDGRQSRKEGFAEYKAETRMLLPIPKFARK